jgi:hypothetical protein
MTDPATLARDWITLWQSELAATAVDREAQETWRAMLALWARSADLLLPSPHDGAPGNTRPDAAPRPPPAAAASEPGVDQVAILERRIAELEARLADMERSRNDRPRRAAKPPSKRTAAD